MFYIVSITIYIEESFSYTNHLTYKTMMSLYHFHHFEQGIIILIWWAILLLCKQTQSWSHETTSFILFDFLSFRSLKMQAIKQIKTFLWKVVDLKCEGLFNCIFHAFKSAKGSYYRRKDMCDLLQIVFCLILHTFLS